MARTGLLACYGDLLVRATAPGPCRRRLVGTVLGMAFGELVFRLLDWEWLQIGMRDAVLALGNLLSLSGGELSETQFRLGQFSYDMTPRCTYADFLCLTTPLVVRFRRLHEDLVLILIWWVGILSFGVVRITAACALRQSGLPWWTSHDAVDYVARVVALLALIYWWLRANSPSVGRVQAGRPEPAAEGGSTEPPGSVFP